MFLLFIPLALLGVPRLYPWAIPFESIQDPTIREHLDAQSVREEWLSELATDFLWRGPSISRSGV